MELFMGKSSINGPFSMAMLNNQRVNLPRCVIWEPCPNCHPWTVFGIASSIVFGQKLVATAAAQRRRRQMFPSGFRKNNPVENRKQDSDYSDD